MPGRIRGSTGRRLPRPVRGSPRLPAVHRSTPDPRPPRGRGRATRATADVPPGSPAGKDSRLPATKRTVRCLRSTSRGWFRACRDRRRRPPRGPGPSGGSRRCAGAWPARPRRRANSRGGPGAPRRPTVPRDRTRRGFPGPIRAGPGGSVCADPGGTAAARGRTRGGRCHRAGRLGRVGTSPVPKGLGGGRGWWPGPVPRRRPPAAPNRRPPGPGRRCGTRRSRRTRAGSRPRLRRRGRSPRSGRRNRCREGKFRPPPRTGSRGNAGGSLPRRGRSGRR